ncbi:MAG: hypothetical protein Q9165_004781 [Trypethelium subeluteriae]
MSSQEIPNQQPSFPRTLDQSTQMQPNKTRRSEGFSVQFCSQIAVATVLAEVEKNRRKYSTDNGPRVLITEVITIYRPKRINTESGRLEPYTEKTLKSTITCACYRHGISDDGDHQPRKLHDLCKHGSKILAEEYLRTLEQARATAEESGALTQLRLDNKAASQQESGKNTRPGPSTGPPAHSTATVLSEEAQPRMDAFRGAGSIDSSTQSHLLVEASSPESDARHHPTRKRPSDILESHDMNPSVSTNPGPVTKKRKVSEKTASPPASSKNSLAQISSKKSATAQGGNSAGEGPASRKPNTRIDGRTKTNIPDDTKKDRHHGRLQQKGARAIEIEETSDDVDQVNDPDIGYHPPAYLYQENAPGNCLQLSDIDARELIDAVHRHMQNAVLNFMKLVYGEENLRGGPGCQTESNPGPALRRLYQRVFGESSWFQRYMTFESRLANSAVLEGLVGAAIYETILKPTQSYPELTLDLADWKILVSWIKKSTELTTTHINDLLERATNEKIQGHDFRPEAQRINGEICAVLRNHIEKMKFPPLEKHGCSHTELLQELLEDAVLAAIVAKAKLTLACDKHTDSWVEPGTRMNITNAEGTLVLKEVWISQFPQVKVKRGDSDTQILKEARYILHEPL